MTREGAAHRGAAVVSIGTTHPWNIAGVGLDLQIGSRLGTRVLTVVAGVSAQDARGVHALVAVEGRLVRAQLDVLPLREVGALRIGVLGSAENARIVAAFVRAHPEIVAVVDPVLEATLGGPLADDATVAVLRDDLARAPSVVLTPNLAEAQRLLGARERIEGMARALQARGARAVLVKGGHLDGAPIDALATAEGVTSFSEERIAGSMRGTGCVLAMALACALSGGASLPDAVVDARRLVRKRIAAGMHFSGQCVAY